MVFLFDLKFDEINGSKSLPLGSQFKETVRVYLGLFL